ncbi:hypothetical protein TVAG_071280 [Trichomonas vaginalis G3]|uniref:Uncharacterized protein n=1 Tax=Trichomonas vaginalis (strain ATCC PRA-98 / G3) TaxID=412133 RepID=A2D831_TRIV3|nr:calcyphosin family [Trichomonas vaginalis G3]EAY23464.1 hypothetical protein TVAG_071280 [Trichomonas vaginalis G3]KAI5493881.1 calcyphosin family [Trichomonas vaginalis G3]|eukprot:XP_001584450.1 hypothetical protein [Trichomonas vaginalis G3]
MNSDTQFLQLNDIIERIHTKIHKHGITGLRKYATLMKEADEDPDRLIDLTEELPDLFADAGIYLNLTEHKELSTILDETGDKKAKFSSIINRISMPLTPVRKTAIAEAFKFFSNGADSCDPQIIKNFRYSRDHPLTFAIKRTPTTKLLNSMIIMLGNSEDEVTAEDFENYFREAGYLFPKDEDFAKILKVNIKKHEVTYRRKTCRNSFTF